MTSFCNWFLWKKQQLLTSILEVTCNLKCGQSPLNISQEDFLYDKDVMLKSIRFWNALNNLLKNAFLTIFFSVHDYRYKSISQSIRTKTISSLENKKAFSPFYRKKCFWWQMNVTHPMGALHSFSIENIFYDKMDLTHFILVSYYAKIIKHSCKCFRNCFSRFWWLGNCIIY